MKDLSERDYPALVVLAIMCLALGAAGGFFGHKVFLAPEVDASWYDQEQKIVEFEDEKYQLVPVYIEPVSSTDKALPALP